MNVIAESDTFRSPTLVQLGQRLLVVIGLVVAATVTVWLFLTWHQMRDAQARHMVATTRLLAGHADHYLRSYAQSLASLARVLAPLDPTGHPDRALPALRSFGSGLPDAECLSLIRADGQMLATTAAAPKGRPLPSFRSDPAWWSDFRHARASTGLDVGRPRPGLQTGRWVIPLRLAIRDARGGVRYWIQADVLLERQQLLWRNLDLPADSVFGLVREDGYLVSRLPSTDPGKLYSTRNPEAGLGDAIRLHPEGGLYSSPAGGDGGVRYGTYQRLSLYPGLYTFLSQDRAVFAGAFWRGVRFPLIAVIITLATGFFAYVGLARRYGNRMRAIEEHVAFADRTSPDTLPSSGVQEIDMLVTALARSRETLRAVAQNRERLLLTAAEAGTYVVRERDGVILSVDDTFAGMLGRSDEQLIGALWSTLVTERETPDRAESGAMDLASRIVSAKTPGDGRERWLSIAEYRDTMLDGERVRHGLAIDVSDREHLLAQVNTQSQRLQALWQLAMSRGRSDRQKMRLMLHMALDTLGMDAVMATELVDGRFVIRELADDLRQFKVGQVLPGADPLFRETVEQRAYSVVPDLRTDTDLYRHPLSVTTGVRGLASVPVYTGSRMFGVMAFLRRAPLGDEFGPDERAFMELLAAWFGQILLEESQRLELERMAMTDSLTRLSNRHAAELRFQEEFARARRDRHNLSIAVCDLDRFKLINDQYGHDVGDQVLVQVAELMKAHLREGDWVARWGGEEFIIFLHKADSVSAAAAMERLRLALRGKPIGTAHGPLDITISIGIGTFRGEGDLATVLSEADGCLYEAKRGGRDAVVTTESSRRSTLWRAGMLQHALTERRIVPAYQVIVDLRSGRPVADEALARLVEPDGRVVPANEFIEAAEGINLIHKVDEIIASQAMARCAADLCSGAKDRHFAHFVNLSPQFLARRELVQAMLQRAAQHCVRTDMVGEAVKPLVLEITERQMLGDFDELMRDLRPLLDFGFRLALDDFGSGYSSFLYLATLPISFLKIEGWMVRNMRDNLKVRAMVRSVIDLAREQGITTIAECVEDAATADLLREVGADWGQGWYFGQPECEMEVAQLLQERHTGTR